ncbi:cholesteryl ester transfer protein isoform X1 [Acanthochromis polyacanthus]|uniref:cholesteryl ester transfer protein isoform X1 n=1 Tax=Acanthochromis polyacanthus TaxID=80966 RepID=UPI002234277E|nr:cholesteryl ester transfer protein isoform X1 [Acanthochromis polyacanthus]
MPRDVFLLLLVVLGVSSGCLQDPTTAYGLTGVVCRLTYPAAVVLNEKTTKVIEAAFQHARYPSMKGEKSLLFVGKVLYSFENLEIHNLSIGRSAFELRPGEGIAMEISNVSAVFRGTIQYGYGSWLVNVGHSLDFEIESQIDLGINPKLYCGEGKVAADTSDCYLNFHKLRLHLQGDKEPNWLKKLFTDFVTFTVKLVVKGQICKEINKVANILADFIQEQAEQFLSDGNISVDIGVTTTPVITANYIESYHKGLTNYNNTTAVIRDSGFHPSQLTEHRMLYFWISDQMLNPILSAAHLDGRFQLNVSGDELSNLLQTHLSSSSPELITQCLKDPSSSRFSVWSSSVPRLNTSSSGSSVWTQASAELHCGTGGTPTLSFQTDVVLDVSVSYSEKKLFLQGDVKQVSLIRAELPLNRQPLQDEKLQEFSREAVQKVGVPKVLSVLDVELTRLLDKQGTNLFTIFNPEVLPGNGFTVIQMDFGFPHHLLVEFLKKTLEST